MKILHSWLEQYISIPFSPEVLAGKLGMLGLEVEAIHRPGSVYEGFSVGNVLRVDKHPNADRLTVCTVALKGKTIQVVCGAPNVAPGQKVAVGIAGAVVPRNQHDPEGKPFTLGKTTIRGIESHGMICSAFELNLGSDADGIMVLDPSARVGTPLSRHLGLDEVIYDLEVTPNRPDWLGHFGIAREIGILTGKTPSLPRVSLPGRSAKSLSRLKVLIEDKVHCMRLAVRVLEGVTIGESPEWLRKALKGIGLRPINTVVDITNFVMMETGQPMHAFDLAMLRGNTLAVRQASRTHPFETLDGKTVQVPPGTVMVCDGEREVSIAGIMGGRNSEISERTTGIVLEAAWWDPSIIRTSARALGISSDASYRFERGIDPDMIPYALDRATQLILETAGGKVSGRTIDIYPGRKPNRRITLRTDRLNKVLGTELRTGEIFPLLKPLGVKKLRTGQARTLFAIPRFRVDLVKEIDLIEEVARLYGYDRIEERATATFSLPSTLSPVDPAASLRTRLVGLGFREVVNFPLVEAGHASVAGKKPVMILNPLSSDMNSLRTSLVPGLLGVIARNLRNANETLRLFESGHVFSIDSGPGKRLVEDFNEERMVGIAMTGRATPPHWSAPDRMADMFDLKGEIQSFVESATLDKCRFICYRTSDSLVEDALTIETLGTKVGYLGRIRSDLLKSFDIEQDVFVAELAPEKLRRSNEHRFKKFPRFPRVRRDVAFVLDKDVPSGEVAEVLISAGSGLVQRAEVFDLYEGKQLPSGKKSLAFSLDLVPEKRTLTESEIDEEVRRVVAAVLGIFDAQLRA